MVSFLSLWQGTAKSLGFKRSQPASGQEESPAKKAKAQAQQQRAVGPMPDTQTGHEREPDAPVWPHSRGDGAANGTQPDSRAAQQPYDPQRYQPQQQPQQPQGASKQQKHVAANPSSSSFTHAAYEKARQTLVQLPAGTAAARRGQHAGAAPHHSLHMPLPRQPAQQQLQAQHGSAGQQQEGLTPFHKRAHSFGRGSPQTFRLTPATGYRVGANSRQAGGYSSLGPPPPPPLALLPRQQQQQQPRPSYASAAAAGRRAAEVATVSRPQLGRPAAAGAGAAQQQQQQHHRAAVAPKPWAAAASGGGGGTLCRSESPPVAQRLFEGIADEQYPAAAAAAAAVQGMAGRQLAAAPGAAGIGSSALTPPANFNAVLQSELQHAGGAPRGLGGSPPVLLQQAAGQAALGSMSEALIKKEAELMAKLKASEAKLHRERQKSKQASQHATKLVGKIDSAFRIDQSPDYKPNLAASAAQLEELREQTIAHNQARMQQQVKYQLQLRQQQLATQQLLQQRAAAAAGAAVPGLPPGAAWKPRAAVQQQQEEQQQEEDEDDDVVVVSSGDGEEGPGSEQQQYTDEVSQLSSQEQEEEEQEEEGSEQEVDEAAAGIEALGITKWTTRRSDWSCTQEQLDRFETHTEDPGEDNEAAVVVVTSHARSSLELTRYDLSTLRPGEWLNDECMNMYMALLQDRDLAGRGAGGLSCYFFNTFFLAKLYVHEGKYNYKNVKRWTMPARLKGAGMPQECVLKCDRVIIPVHQGNHWTALMVDVAARRLVFFDSMLGENRRAMAEVKKWVADEAKDKLQATWDTSAWEEVYPADIPRQQNGFDCGVFALMFCNRMGVRGAAFDFTQDDIRHNIRAAIVCDLLDGRIAATAWRG